MQHVTYGPEDETQHLTFQSVQLTTTERHLSTLRIVNRKKKMTLPLFPNTLGACAFGKNIYNKGHFLSKRKTALNVHLSLNGGDSGY